MWQSDLVYTIESVLPFCEKSYHMNNGFEQMWAEIKVEPCIPTFFPHHVISGCPGDTGHIVYGSRKYQSFQLPCYCQSSSISDSVEAS